MLHTLKKDNTLRLVVARLTERLDTDDPDTDKTGLYGSIPDCSDLCALSEMLASYSREEHGNTELEAEVWAATELLDLLDSLLGLGK